MVSKAQVLRALLSLNSEKLRLLLENQLELSVSDIRLDEKSLQLLCNTIKGLNKLQTLWIYGIIERD
jgi:hypothetical protein